MYVIYRAPPLSYMPTISHHIPSRDVLALLTYTQICQTRYTAKEKNYWTPHRLAPFIGQLHPEGANQPLDQELAAEANSGWSPENKGREGGERKQEAKHNTHILGSCLARNTPTLMSPNNVWNYLLQLTYHDYTARDKASARTLSDPFLWQISRW